MTAHANGHSPRAFGMPLRALSNPAHPRASRRAVVALAASRRPDLQRLLEALESTDIEVTELPAVDGSASVPSSVTPDVIAYVCDPAQTEPTTIRHLRETLPGIALLLVVPAVADAAPVVRRALSIGADGVVLEQDLDRMLATAILALASGLRAVPRSAYRSLQPPQLTYREKQVLTLAISGYTNAEIGGRLFLAESTVKSHLSSAYRRLGVTSRREAAALVLDPEEGLRLSVLVDLARPHSENGALTGGGGAELRADGRPANGISRISAA